MDAKEVKSTLKAAREAIRQKDFKEALKCCKAVLKADKDNYNALVFVGVSAEGLEQPDQSVKAFERAIEVSPEQLLAWQGLCSFYEKSSSKDHKQALVSVYEKLVALHNGEQEKCVDTLIKLGDLCSSQGQLEKAVSVYHRLLKEGLDKPRQIAIWRKIIGVLGNLSSLTTDQENMLLEAYKVVLTSEEQTKCEAFVEPYIQLLNKREDYEEAETESERLSGLIPLSPYPLIILLQKELDIQTAAPSRNSAKIVELNDRLKKVDSASHVIKLGEGFTSLCEKDYSTAKAALSEGLKASKGSVCGHVALAEVLVALSDPTSALIACKSALENLKSKKKWPRGDRWIEETTRRINFLQLRVWLSQGTESSLQMAVDALKQLVSDNTTDREAICMLIGAYLKQRETTHAEALLNKHADTLSESGEVWEIRGRIAFANGDSEKALECLQLAAKESGDRADVYLELGRVYWSMGCQQDQSEAGKLIILDQSALEKSFNSWLKAAKLNPFDGEAFRHLGDFYSHIQKDLNKARRCYQKSFSLSPHDDLAGAALCDTLTALGEKEAAHSIIISVTSQASAGSVKWAWLRLGLYQLVTSDPSTAVTSFQAALRADPKDNHVWECLAEAYYKRGSFTAALKAFTRALELDPTSLYCLYQIAFIKQTLGQLTEAVEEYKTVLKTSTDYVPALKGAGETLIMLARSHLRQAFNLRAVTNCTEAILHLTRAASLRPDLSCVWKLLGDACSVLHPLSAQGFSVSVPVKLIEKGPQDKEKTTDLNKQQLLQLGSRCYGQALKLLPGCAALWHDLGVNFLHQSETLSGEAASAMVTKSLQVLQKAVTLDPLDFRHWMALGRVACHPDINNASLAQHCFIKSIQIEKMNVVAWTNLGTLYLKNDNIQLAHEAFTVAQSLDPSYVACWIGQAMIAEMVGHEDAMDLFRHTTELGNHLESALGYSHWVCTVIGDLQKRDSPMYQYCIKQMAAVPMATDALTKYLDRVKDNAAAYNLFGLLLETQGLLKSATEAFKSALDILERTSAPTEQIAQARINYARVLCSDSQPEESVRQYLSVTTPPGFSTMCGLALAYYKLNKLADSYQAYEKALELTDSDEDRSHVYAAMGMVAYKFNDMDGVKTALFSCSQTTPSSNQGLVALCSFGFLHSDSTLLRAALEELSKKKAPDLLKECTLFTVALHILEDAGGVESVLTEAVSASPDSASLWHLQSSLLLTLRRGLGYTAASSALKAAQLDNNYTKESLVEQTLGLLASGNRHWEASESGDRLTTLAVAQKAVHLAPDKPEPIATLISALHTEAMCTAEHIRKAALIEVELRFISFLLQDVVKLSAELRGWLISHEMMGLIMENRVNEARNRLSESEVDKDNGHLETLLRVSESLLAGDTTTLKTLLGEAVVSPFFWQLLAGVSVKAGDPAGADSAYRQCLQHADCSQTSPRQTEYIPLIRLSHLAFQQITRGGHDSSQWQRVFDEAAAEVKTLEPNSTAVLLMEALLSLHDNPRLSKRHLSQILENKKDNSSCCSDFVLTLARKLIIQILKESKKDPQVLEDFLKECELSGDTTIIDWYKTTYPQQKQPFKTTETAPKVEPMDQWDNC